MRIGMMADLYKPHGSGITNYISLIEVVPNGVDLQRYRQVCENCRPELGLGSEEVILVSAGRLAPEKSLDFLLNAFAGTAEAVANAHIIFIGGGPEEETLRRQAAQTSVSERIHFTGVLPYEGLPRYLAMSDAAPEFSLRTLAERFRE